MSCSSLDRKRKSKWFLLSNSFVDSLDENLLTFSTSFRRVKPMFSGLITNLSRIIGYTFFLSKASKLSILLVTYHD